MSTTVATRRGICASCKGEYRPGQLVTAAQGGTRHAACTTVTMSLKDPFRTSLRKRPLGHRF